MRQNSEEKLIMYFERNSFSIHTFSVSKTLDANDAIESEMRKRFVLIDLYLSVYLNRMEVNRKDLVHDVRNHLLPYFH